MGYASNHLQNWKNRNYYFGASRWKCVVNRETIIIELPVPQGNRKEDEGMVRYKLRQKLGVRSLPPGTTVEPIRAVS